MADISYVSRLIAGVQRNVDLSTNTIVVSSIKIGASALEIKETAGHFDFSAKNLTNVGNVDGRDVSVDGTALDAHLNGGASKHDATEIDYERVDGSKKNIAAASDDIESAVTNLDDAIGALDATPTNYTAANPAIVADHLAGIDSALASAGGVEFNDSTFRIYDNTINTKKIAFEASGITAATTRTVTMPDANVNLGALTNSNIDAAAAIAESKLALDYSTSSLNTAISNHLADASDAHDASAISSIAAGNLVATDVQAALNELDSEKVAKAGDTMSGNLAMGSNKVTGLAAGTTAGDAVRYEQAILASGVNAFTAAQSMGGFKLTSLGAPTAASDAATKGYVDNALEGLKPKTAVRVATTANIVIATALNSGDSIDGITLANGDRVLVKDQTAAEFNGIYIVGVTPARSTDMDSLSPIDEINKSIVAVQEGTANAGKIFVQYGTVTTLDTDAINFTFFNSISGLVGGDGITVSGSNISVDHDGEGLQFVANQLALEIDGSTLSKSATGLKVASGGITNTEVNASAAIAYSKLTLTGSIVNADVNASAAIAYSKLNLATSIVNADISASAAIAYSKLNLATSIVNADINASAAIAYSKLNLSASIVNADVAAGAAIAYSKLALTNSIVAGDLTDDSVTKAKINADVAGSGLGQNVDGSLEVNTGDGIEIATDAVKVKVTDLVGEGIEHDGSNNFRVKLDGTSISRSASGIKAEWAPLLKKSMIAGEAFAANTSFLVRWAINSLGDTAGRVYKADKDAATTNKFHAVGILMSTSALSAADPVDVLMLGEHTLGASDASFAAGDEGKEVFVGTSGAFILGAALANTANEAQYCVGVVSATNKIIVDGKSLRGIA